MSLLLLLAAAQSPATPVRVTAWNLPSSDAATNGLGATEVAARAAGILKKLNSDVIILENVPDRESCQRLADALKPQNFQIAACSSFLHAPDGKKTTQQVAILSRTRALLAWSEAWQSSGGIQALPGGFAFAEIPVGEKNLGLLVAHLGLEESGASPDRSSERQSCSAATGQLLKTAESFRNWHSNRIDAVVLAGDLQSTGDARSECRLAFSTLVNNGFHMAQDWLPEKSPSVVDYIFTRGARPFANAVISPGRPVTWDISLDEPELAARKSKPDAAPKTGSRPLATKVAKTLVASSRPAHANEAPTEKRAAYWRRAGVFAAGLFVFLIVWRLLFLGRFKPSWPAVSKSNLQTVAENQSVLLSQNLSPAERASLLSHLSLWLKHKLVQKLVSDRAQLLATQQAAALAVISMDERLTNVEKLIQRRNQEYEQRIGELLKELAVAQEENRELIRSKIELLKLEIAKSSVQPASFPSRN